MKLVIYLFVFLFSFSAAAEFACNDSFKRKYVKGSYSASNKVFKFKEMRDEIMSDLGEGITSGDQTICLMEFYQKSMADSAEYWAKRQAEDSCTEACQNEYDKSTAYLANLDSEFRSKVAARLPAARKAADEAAADTERTMACRLRADGEREIAAVKNNMCCGSPEENGTGAVRAIYPNISYNTCLSKIQPTQKAMLSGEGLGECAQGLVVEFAKTIFHNLKSLVTLPLELWGARSQIWQIITNGDARAAFANKVLGMVKNFVVSRVDSLTTCLNAYEKKQYLCKAVGEVLGHLATPGAVAKILKLGSAAARASSNVIGEILSQTGQKVLNGLNKARGPVKNMGAALGDARAAAVAAAKKAAAAQLVSAKKALGKLTEFTKNQKTSFQTRLSEAIEKHGRRREIAAKTEPTVPTNTVRGTSPEPEAIAAAELTSGEASLSAVVDNTAQSLVVRESKGGTGVSGAAAPSQEALVGTQKVSSMAEPVRVNSPVAAPVTLSSSEGQQLVRRAQFFGEDQATFLKRVKEHKIEPKETLTVGESKISLSEPFDVGGGRVAALAVVESGGVTSTRVYYRSNSQGVFRLLPGKSESGWFSKGLGESSLDAPSEVQRLLAQQISAGKVRTDVPKAIFEESVPVYKSEYLAMKAAGEDPALAVKQTNLLRESTAETIPSKYSTHVKPQDVVVQNVKHNPEFSNPVSTYQTSTGAAGDVKATVFRSKDGSLEYTFFEDKTGRAWVASVTDVNASVNSAGIRAHALKTGDLAMPRYEYHQQIPTGYSAEGRFGPRGEYGDAWKYLKEVPMIQDYYRSRGLAVPP